MKNKSSRKKSLDLPKEFTLFNSTHHLIEKTDRILLAVSGGMDSVALFHLFRLKGFSFSVAHCNFKLRGRHSEKDEKFVRELCSHYGIQFFSKSFDTETFSDEHGISIQMAARDLRYAWFNKLMKEYSLDLLCTAHHLDDSIETVLLNLARGTGVNGLTGIQAKSGKLVRPLLFANKKQIASFIRQHEFKFRKDKSNEELKYKRNLVRKKIIPLFEKLNPSFVNSMAGSIDHFREAQKLINSEINKVLPSITKVKKEEIIIDLEKLNEFSSPTTALHSILEAHGIGSGYFLQVTELINAQSGKYIDAGAWIILKNRNKIVISRKQEVSDKPVLVHEKDKTITGNVILEFSEVIAKNDLKTSHEEIIVDHSLLKYPLEVRPWQKGDRFIPFGLKGSKKVSDLLVDLKVSRTQKSRVSLLINGDGKIIWVIGLRLDNRFRIQQPNVKALIVKLLNPDYL